MDEAAACRAIDRCLTEGIHFFDTANVYNKGAAEALLGKALAGRRQTVIVATKVGFKSGMPDGKAGLSRAAIRKSLEEPLLARCDTVWKRLRGITPKYNR